MNKVSLFDIEKILNISKTIDSEYLFVVQKINNPHIVRIGSTNNLCYGLEEYVLDSDNSEFNIWSFEIINSMLKCHELNKFIQNNSKMYQQPYDKCIQPNSCEHYYFTEITILEKFLNDLEIEYCKKEEKIDDIKKSYDKIRSRILENFSKSELNILLNSKKENLEFSISQLKNKRKSLVKNFLTKMIISSKDI